MGKGMGKKKAGLVEAITDATDILVEDKTRCGPIQTIMWICLLAAMFGLAGICFIWPYETYAPHHAGCEWTKYLGPHYVELRDRFWFSHIEKEIDVCTYPSGEVCGTQDCAKQTVHGVLSFKWLILMFSTLSALPYFVTFIFYPGWAYKLHFRGGGAMCCGRIPLTCGKVASANDEQSHQADQMSRLLGIFIGLTFGIINYFTRMGMVQELQDDGLICHSAIWALCSVFHISSLWNKGSPRCYALYQLIFSAALGGLMYMTTGALDDLLKFSLNTEMASTF